MYVYIYVHIIFPTRRHLPPPGICVLPVASEKGGCAAFVILFLICSLCRSVCNIITEKARMWAVSELAKAPGLSAKYFFEKPA